VLKLPNQVKQVATTLPNYLFSAERDEEHTEDISVCIAKFISILLAKMEKLV
jgi:hypothetical protein